MLHPKGSTSAGTSLGEVPEKETSFESFPEKKTSLESFPEKDPSI